MTQPALPLADQWLRPTKPAKATKPRAARKPKVVPLPTEPVVRTEPGFGAPDLLLEIPNPDDWISSNDRKGRTPQAVKALEARFGRLVKAWQNTAWLVTKSAKATGRFRWVRIVAWRDGPNVDNHHDPANYYPTAKAAVDGAVKAGLVPDDDWKHVIGPDMRRGVLHPAPGRLVLGIYDLTRRETQA